MVEAALKDDADAVKALLTKGANSNAKDRRGLTVLMAAANGGHTHAVWALLEAGADVNANDGGETVLMAAAMEGLS